MVKFLDLHKQYLSIKKEVDQAMAEVVSRATFIHGPQVQAFEAAFAHYLGVQYCVGVGNGTDALEIAIEALDLPPNSEILVPANTFIACAEAVTRSGHRVLFCDCNPDDYTLDVDDARRRATSETRAVIAVHLYGHPCRMDEVMSMASDLQLKVIEDCSQAHGATYHGQKVGGIGHVGTYSFYPGKNLGAFGDGGAIVCQDEALSRQCRMIANHGRINKYEHEFEGRNSRLDSLQAAILTVKLAHLDDWIRQRNRVAQYYLQGLQDQQAVILPTIQPDVGHAFHLFVIRSPQRACLIDCLRKNDIQTGIHYPLALPKQKAYAHLGQEQTCRQAGRMDQELLSLPMGEHLGEPEVQFVCAMIRRALDHSARAISDHD